MKTSVLQLNIMKSGAIYSCFVLLLAYWKTKHVACQYVWLTVDPECQESYRKVRLNWDAINPKSKGLWIGLFDRPVNDTAFVTDSLLNVKSPGKSGALRTNFKFPKTDLRSINLTKRCLHFWIALVNDHQVISVNCIRIEPTWMTEKYDAISQKTLKELMIPGSHNSASYRAVDTKSASTKFVGKALSKYVLCQDENIFNQLAYGIRFLDLRVLYETGVSGEDLWMAHGIFRMNISLREVLQQVKLFLEKTEREILILDFHRFGRGFEGKNGTGSNDNLLRHKKVIELVKEHLMVYLARNISGYSVTIEELIQNGSRVIIGYPTIDGINEDFLFLRSLHLWAATDDLAELERFLGDSVCYIATEELQSSMAHLTPTVWGILFDKYNGLASLARETNPIITKWFRKKWWSCANVVSTDFVLSSNIIETCIANVER